MFDRYGLRRGRALRRKFQLLPGEKTHGRSPVTIGLQRSVETRQPGNTTGGIDESDCPDVHGIHFDRRRKWSLRGVLGIDRTGFPRDLRVAAAGKSCRQLERELRGEGKILDRDIYIVVDDRLGRRVRLADRDSSTFHIQLRHRDARRSRFARFRGLWRLLSGSSADA